MVKPNQLFPKAYFNWVRQKWEADPATPVEPWQVEDYRELLTVTLFERLESLGLSLTAENFFQIAESYKSPEELTHALWPDKSNEFPVYLLLFELWRRLLPDKQSISIFCDELDYRIRLYLKNPAEEENHLRNSLQRMEELLEESCDAGENPQSAFAALERHVAYDLEGFLYDYILDQTDNLEATELLTTFYPYVSEKIWFDFLKARLLILIDSHEGNLAFLKLLEQKPDVDLLLEMSAFLIHHGDPVLFQKTALLALNQIETEEDFQELLATIGDYCHFVEKDDEESKIQALFAKRMELTPDKVFSPKDPDAKFLQGVLNELQRTKI